MTAMPTGRTASMPFRAAAYALAAVLCSTPAFAIDVKTDHDREADFSKRKTWAWKPGTEAPNPLTEQKIRMAVESAMRAKGLQKVESAPDLWVVTHTTATMESRIVPGLFLAGEILDLDSHLREIVINATEFKNGLAFRFQRSDDAQAVFGNQRLRLSAEEARAVRLADSVAASSCFPGAFEPMVFPRDFS